MGTYKPGRAGVVLHDRDHAYSGYTLLVHTTDPPDVSAGQASLILLVDMDGVVVHRWVVDTSAQLAELASDGSLYYSTRDRSRIEPGGGGPAGLYRVTPKGRVSWDFHCRIDHDFCLMDNGHITVHCIMDKMVPAIGPGLRRCPYIVEVTPNRKVVWEWFGEEHLDDISRLCGIAFPLSPSVFSGYPDQSIENVAPDGSDDNSHRALGVNTLLFDWAHNNTCEVLPETPTGERDPRFRAGNILFSYRSLDTIGCIDRETGEIVWAWGRGVLDGQHQPTMLPNGHILVFDNGTLRGWSRVLEIDPLSEEVVWEYSATPRESFFSAYISGAQRLPNGNTLITEGGRDRLLEVTPLGETVWEFRSPFAQAIPSAPVHGIYRATRYSPEFVAPLLERFRA